MCSVSWLLTLCISSVVLASETSYDYEFQVHGENEDETEPYSVKSIDLNPVNFYLYTRANPDAEIQITPNRNTITASQFNASKPTYFVIHGWVNSHNTSYIKNITTAALKVFDCNVIMIDWPRAHSVDYLSSVIAVPEVGEKVADMINFLRENFKMPLETLTIVGHSLGAEVAGYTGKNVQTGKVHSIIALDPAHPLFSYDNIEKRLNVNDAVYVQAIYTSYRALTFLQPLGKADFFVNGGGPQPGCENELFGFCSHIRSTMYYAEVLELNDFGSIKCENYEQALNKSCGNTVSSVRMGARNSEDEVEGIYYVPVNNDYPYGVLKTDVEEK